MKGQSRVLKTFRLKQEAIDMVERVAKKYGWRQSDVLEDLIMNGLKVLDQADMTPNDLLSQAAKEIGVMMYEIGENLEVSKSGKSGKSRKRK